MLASLLTVLPVVAETSTPTAAAISVGGQHVCALAANGIPWCWGSNSWGQLGRDTYPAGVSETPTPVPGVSRAVGIASGDIHTCALLANGRIQCWGDNRDWQLGNDTTGGYSFSPVFVSGITDAVKISAGSEHTCALTATGTIRCWGDNGALLGYGSNSATLDKVTVTGITNAIDLSAGNVHSCAVLSTGSVKCWGNNFDAQLGTGSSGGDSGTSFKFNPVTVSGITTAIGVAAGHRFTCVLLSGGTVKCWGDNEDDQLGYIGAGGPTPVTIDGITGATQISGKGTSVCVRLGDATEKCWGNNDEGELGDGTWVSKPTPVSPGLTDITTISSGPKNSCALLGDGSTKCWGANNQRQIGIINENLANVLVPTTTPGFSRGPGGAGNDNFPNAQWVATPFTDSVDVTDASAESGEPTPSCAAGSLTSNGWYRYQTSIDRSVTLSAVAGSYLAVYTGTAANNLVEQRCLGPGGADELDLAAGNSVYLQVAQVSATTMVSVTTATTIGFSLADVSDPSPTPLWSDPSIIKDHGNVQSTSASAPSVAYSANGKLHVAYIIASGATSGLYYATNQSGSWQNTRLANVSTRGDEWTSIDVDASGRIHIVYQKLGAGIFYLSNASGPWASIRIAKSGTFVTHPEIDVDASGKAHVVYFTPSTAGLRYATNRTGSWVRTRITTNSHDTRADVAVDAANKVHVLIGRDSKGYRYMTNKSGSWAGSAVTTDSRIGLNPSIEIDTQGRPILGFTSSDGANAAVVGVWTAVKASSGWTKTRLSTFYSNWSQVRADPDGSRHLAAFGVTHFANGSGSWLDEQAAANKYLYSNGAFDVGPAGQLAVVYVRTDYSLVVVTSPAS
jgi:alpha-tubulin suppressor-like RCC1 family protein